MRFTEQNTGGMKLCTGFIIVKFYVYEVLNRCVFKLVLNLSYVSMFLTCSGRLFHNTGAAYENMVYTVDVVYCIRYIFRESNFSRIGTSRHFREWLNSRSRRSTQVAFMRPDRR